VSLISQTKKKRKFLSGVYLFLTVTNGYPAQYNPYRTMEFRIFLFVFGGGNKGKNDECRAMRLGWFYIRVVNSCVHWHWLPSNFQIFACSVWGMQPSAETSFFSKFPPITIEAIQCVTGSH
jgi:hypothetical protein